MGEGWRGEHSLAQVMMGMFEAGGPVSASALRLMESGRHSHRAVDAMRQVQRRTVPRHQSTLLATGSACMPLPPCVDPPILPCRVPPSAAAFYVIHPDGSYT